MNHLLMHSEIPVVDLEISDTGRIVSTSAVHNESHLPVGVSVRGGVVNRTSLNEWWLDRSIPASRSSGHTKNRSSW